jgi:hypothetical protein
MSVPRKILAMYLHFGKLVTDKTCKNCCHLKKFCWRGKNYYKCQVYGISNSEATDWRLWYPACGAFNAVALKKRDLYKDLWHSSKENKDEEPLSGQIKFDV